MKRTAVTLMMTGALVLSLGVLGFAQMGTMSKPADSSQAGQKPANMNETQLVDQMASNHENMTNHFDSLQTMWNKMMVMNNVSDLEAGWKTYKAAMKVMQHDMSRQGAMYQEAMQSEGNNGMMMNADQKEMLQKMENNYETMSSRFDSLKTMTDRMINMGNMTKLKSAMKNYQRMMTNMHTAMANQGTMYKRMMAMMGQNGGMNHRMMQHDNN